MLQGIGAILIILATTSTGAALGAREKYRLKDLEQLERALLLMKNQISYLGTPLAELLEQISWKVEGVIGTVLQEISRCMTARDSGTAEEIWERIWLETGKNTYLTAADLDEVIAFGKTLGFLEKQQQEGSVTLLLLYLREGQSRIKKRMAKNGKLYYSMGVLSGLLLVITLL